MNRTPLTVIAGVVALLTLSVALLVGLSFSRGLDQNSTPFVTAFLSIVAATVPAMLALLKAEQTHRDLTNGTVVRKVKEAVTAPDTLEALSNAVSLNDGDFVDSAGENYNDTAKEGE